MNITKHLLRALQLACAGLFITGSVSQGQLAVTPDRANILTGSSTNLSSSASGTGWNVLTSNSGGSFTSTSGSAATYQGGSTNGFDFIENTKGSDHRIVPITVSAQADLTIEMTSLDILWIDANKPETDGPRGAWLSYKVTNQIGGTNLYTDLMLTFDGFDQSSQTYRGTSYQTADPLFIDPTDDERSFGSLADGESVVFYFYVDYAEAIDQIVTNDSSPAVTLNTSNPLEGFAADYTLTVSSPELLGGTNEVIQGSVTTKQLTSANAAGLVVDDTLSSGFFVGQIIEQEVTFEFGNNLGTWFMPASEAEFKDEALRLIDVVVTGPDANNDGILDGSNIIDSRTGSAPLIADLDNHTFFHFLDVSGGGDTLEVTFYWDTLEIDTDQTVTPWAGGRSGNAYKYQLASTTNSVTIPDSVQGLEIDKRVVLEDDADGSGDFSAGDTVRYIVTITNTSFGSDTAPLGVDIFLDSITDVLPQYLWIDDPTVSPVSDVTVGNSSSIPTGGGVGVGEGSVTNSTVVQWIGKKLGNNTNSSYKIEPQSILELVYIAEIDPTAPDGIYTNFATGQVGNETVGPVSTIFIIGDICFVTCPPAATVECTNLVPTAAANSNDFVTAGGEIIGCTDVTSVTHTDVDDGGTGCSSNPLEITRTYTITYGGGNSSTCIQTFTVVDTTAPILTPATNLTVECDGLGNTNALNDWLDANGGATASNNCGGVTWSNDFLSISNTCGAGGTSTVTFTATDACGNSSNTAAIFTIEDTTAPSIDSPATNLTVECDGFGNTNALNAWLDASGGAAASNACGGVTWSNDFLSISNTCGAGGTSTVTFTATDACGNSTSTVAIFTIEDTTAPSITNCPAGAQFSCFADVPEADTNGVGVVDNCDTNVQVSVLITNISGGGCATDTGVVEYVYQATDACGNSSTCTQTFTVVDTTTPSIDSPATNLTVECDGLGNTNALNAWLDANGGAAASNNCGGVTWSNDFLSISNTCGAGGTSTVTFTATDACGNSTNTLAIFTIEDTTAPAITNCPMGRQVECFDLVPEADTNLVGVIDNCDSNVQVSVILTNISGGGCAADTGIVEYVYQATDACGNSATCTQTFTVADTTAPSITNCPAGDQVECFDDVPEADTNAVGVIDNCDTNVQVSVIATNISGDGCAADTGIVEYVYQATDACGNSATCTQTFTVVDTTAPAITNCPEGDLVQCFDDVPEADTNLVGVSDNCDTGVLVSVIATNILGDGCDRTGVVEYVYQATDACGNSATCTQTFTVVDTTAPSITNCPAGDQVECFDDVPEADTNAVGVIDNCDSNVQVSVIATNISGDGCAADTGIVEYVYQATDACGNSATCTQTFTVVDTTAPAITNCPAGDQVECFDDVPEADTNLVGVSDNCDTNAQVSVIATNISGGGCAADTGIVEYVYQATDACGNSATCTQTFTVVDTTAPSITNCPAGDQVECFDDVPEADTNGVGVIDNCDTNVQVSIVATNISGGGCAADTGIVEYVYQATDACGNSATCTQTFTVVDTTAPAITNCPANSNVQCIAEITPPNPGNVQGFDNCDTNPVVTVVAPLQFIAPNETFCSDNPHIVQYVYIMTDACGNSATCTQTFTVADTTAPSITNCPEGDLVQCFDGVPDADTNLVGVTDNCDPGVLVSVIATNISGGGCADSTGLVEYVYQATDACGNSATCTQTFTVVDTTAPSITNCPEGDLVQCFDDVPEADTNLVGVIDNCDTGVLVSVIATNILGDGCADSTGVVEYVYQATDACGNSATCTQTFTVVDTTAPAITNCPEGDLVQCFEDVPVADTNLVGVSDNCDTNVQVSVIATNTLGDGCADSTGIVEYVYQATDACGNSATCTQTFTVVDTTAPVITDPATNLVVECDGLGNTNELTAWLDASGGAFATDTCSRVGWTNDYDSTNFVAGCGGGGTAVVVFTVSDACGNTSTTTSNFVIVDTTAPAITNCPDGDLVQCFDDVPEADTNLVGVSDNCDTGVLVSVIATNTLGGGCADSTGIVEYVYQATDACGNSATCTQTFTVVDTTAPAITNCPEGDLVQCFEDVPEADTNLVGASDNCHASVLVSVIATNISGGGCADSTGLVEYVYQATDACGNSATCTQTFTVVDTTPPSITNCPVGDQVECFDLVPEADTNLVGVSDNCDTTVQVSVILTNITGSGCADDPGIVEHVYLATDACGNTATCTQTFTVVDTTAPTITNCPADSNVQCIAEIAPPDPGNVQGFDNCDTNPVVTVVAPLQSIVPFGSFCSDNPHIVQYVYTMTDACGNSATCTQTFTVADTTAPVITNCPEGDLVQCFDGVPEADTNLVGVTDNCDPGVLVSVIATNTLGDGCADSTGIVEYVYQATDACGNSATCTQTFTVVDTTAPSITNCPAGDQVECFDDVPEADTNAVGVIDNCDSNVQVSVIATNISGGGCATDAGIVEYVYQATDACGNSATCTQTFTVVDTTAPSITNCPADDLVDCFDEVPEADTNGVGVIDSCDTNVQVSVIATTITGGGCAANTGIVEYVYLATDACGNTATCTQTFTVVDTRAPSIDSQATNLTVECDGFGNTNALNDWLTSNGGATASDNCSEVTWSNHFYVIESDSCGASGTSTVTFTATDACGNSSNTVASFIIEDTTPPEIICPSNAVVACTNDYSPGSLGSATATDDCSTQLVPTWQDVDIGFPCQGVGYIERTWTVVDDCGNSNSCVQTIEFLGSITGTVKEDFDGDGIGDANLLGVTIDLLDSTGSVVQTTTTLADGSYSFANVEPGEYTVVEADPDGYDSFSDEDTSNDGDTTVNVDMNDNSIPVTVTSSEIDEDNNFIDVLLGEIIGTVLLDENGDGLPAGDTNGIEGVTVVLTDTNDNPIATNVTDGSGEFIFTNVPPGNYIVQEVDPEGYFSTADSDGTNDNEIAVTLVTGDEPGENYFLDAEYASISGSVFDDANGDGLFAGDTNGIAGVTILLVDSSNGLVVATNITDQNGAYSFDEVLPGVYNVIEVNPANALSTADVSGPNDDLIPDIAVDLGDVIPDQDFLDVQYAEISGTVWSDVNANGTIDEPLPAFGLPNVTVTLTGTTTTGAAVNITTVTTANGYYVFPDLLPGTYSVSVGAGVPATLPNTSTPTSYTGLNLVSGQTILDPAGSGQFGFYPTPTAIQLVRLDAILTDDGVRVEWETGSEIDALFFNILWAADADSEPIKVNAQPILAQGRAYSYTWFHAGSAGGFYWLEEVDNKMVSTLYGPEEADSTELLGTVDITVAGLYQVYVDDPSDVNVMLEGIILPAIEAETSLIFLALEEGTSALIIRSDKPVRMEKIYVPAGEGDLRTELLEGDQQLMFTTDGHANYLILGYTGQPIVLDISDPDISIQMIGDVLEADGLKSVYFGYDEERVIFTGNAEE